MSREIEMTTREATREFAAIGLVVSLRSPAIWVVGDPNDRSEEVRGYHWACWLEPAPNETTRWRVVPEPSSDPGPGSDFIVPDLRSAVSLTRHFFEHRGTIQRGSTRERGENNARAYQEWLSSGADSGADTGAGTE